MSVQVVAFEPSAEYRAVVSCLFQQGEDSYDVVSCEAWDAFEEAVASTSPGLVLVSFADVPGGVEGLANLRRDTDAPIMAFVEGQDETKAALRGGADYDLPKPFDPEVFLVAVEAVLRRSGGGMPAALQAGSTPLIVDGLKIYPDRRTVERDGRRQSLSQTEWQLFSFLVANPGRVFSRRELAAGAWGPGYTSRAGQAELYVSRVRRKVERDGQRPRIIETVRGRGYRLISEVGGAVAS